MQDKPFYRLKELIIEKYGEDKFETGCELVAHWISNYPVSKFETKEITGAGLIVFLCNQRHMPSTGNQLSSIQARALKSLFKLNSYKELYTLPETTPEFFN